MLSARRESKCVRRTASCFLDKHKHKRLCLCYEKSLHTLVDAGGTGGVHWSLDVDDHHHRILYNYDPCMNAPVRANRARRPHFTKWCQELDVVALRLDAKRPDEPPGWTWLVHPGGSVRI